MLDDFKINWYNFLIFFSSTKTQASCLNDVPTTVARYDFLKEGQRPGEQYNALEQCQQSFGSNFVPHVKPKEPPFEVKKICDGKKFTIYYKMDIACETFQSQ